MDEVVQEEVWEYQVREPGSLWVPETEPVSSHSRKHDQQAGTAGRAGVAAGAGVRRKEDVVLPKGGWRWAGEWQPDMRGRGCDAEGWQYRAQQGEHPGEAWCRRHMDVV